MPQRNSDRDIAATAQNSEISETSAPDYDSAESLQAERRGLELRREECLRAKQEVPALEELVELRQILEKQQKYSETLGFFQRSDRRRMEEQIRSKKAEIEQKEIEVELQQERYDEEIINLNLAIDAITTELERLQLQADSEDFR